MKIANGILLSNAIATTLVFVVNATLKPEAIGEPIYWIVLAYVFSIVIFSPLIGRSDSFRLHSLVTQTVGLRDSLPNAFLALGFIVVIFIASDISNGGLPGLKSSELRTFATFILVLGVFQVSLGVNCFLERRHFLSIALFMTAAIIMTWFGRRYIALAWISYSALILIISYRSVHSLRMLATIFSAISLVSSILLGVFYTDFRDYLTRGANIQCEDHLIECYVSAATDAETDYARKEDLKGRLNIFGFANVVTNVSETTGNSIPFFQPLINDIAIAVPGPVATYFGIRKKPTDAESLLLDFISQGGIDTSNFDAPTTVHALSASSSIPVVASSFYALLIVISIYFPWWLLAWANIKYIPRFGLFLATYQLFQINILEASIIQHLITLRNGAFMALAVIIICQTRKKLSI